MDDDVMPNDGTFSPWREPKDQVLGRKKEQAQVMEGIHVLEAQLKRWKEKVAFYESVRAIPEDVKVKPDEFMHTVAANAVVVEILQAEIEYTEELISNYAPSR